MTAAELLNKVFGAPMFGDHSFNDYTWAYSVLEAGIVTGAESVAVLRANHAAWMRSHDEA